MTSTVIITFCSLLLVAYLFDLTASKTKIPSVILLLLLGWGMRQATDLLEIQLPDLSIALPIFGTIGLILIVLEGALELELNKRKWGLIGKSSIGALLPMAAMAACLAFTFNYMGGYSIKDSLTNSIPFCIISSAIAIPSVRNLVPNNREFVIYESSLSDIFGVILFNFFALNETIDAMSFAHFGLELLIISVVSIVATIGLSFLLSKIQHHVKFIPIVLLVILIYAVSKIYHLPALIFILFFGLAIGNLDELKHIKWVQYFKPEILNREVHKFKELTAEGAFLVRSLFFILFGYLLESSELLNIETLPWAFFIVFLIYFFRTLQLVLIKLPLMPLLFVAPRGLITILLFFSIAPTQMIPLVNRSLVIQVIVMTALWMMLGLMLNTKKASPEVVSKDLEAP